MARRKRPIAPEVLDQLLDGSDPQKIFESDGLIDELKRALAERILDAEMDVHLGGELEHARGNHRNGHSKKTVLTDSSALELSIPRDRHGRFEPQLIEKYRRRFPGFDEKIIALYARGMSTRDIQAHVGELYGLEISPDLVSAVTDSVLDEVQAWQGRPLESVYAVVYFDALRVKIRDEGTVRNKAVYLAIGIRCSGYKEILGLWIEQTEGAKFWLKVMTELRTRGTEDILVAVVDGLRGFPEAIGVGVPRGARPDVHRAPDSPLAQVCQLEGAQTVGRRPQTDLPSRDGGGGPPPAGRIRAGSLGSKIPDRRAELAAAMGAGDSVFCLRSRDPQDHLHDQCH